MLKRHAHASCSSIMLGWSCGLCQLDGCWHGALLAMATGGHLCPGGFMARAAAAWMVAASTTADILLCAMLSRTGQLHVVKATGMHHLRWPFGTT